MNARKIVTRSLVAALFILVAGSTWIVGSSYLQHQRLVREEKASHPPPGTMVDVHGDGNRMHVFSAGEGDETLVFLSGLGTSSPVYDFKPIYDQFLNEYRIAVVERFGYGWSDITGTSRDIETVLTETRTALRSAGVSPPYVLFVHSMAGLEALYWADRYPEEIRVIIGLDPLTPTYYTNVEFESPLSRVETLLARSGLIRSSPDNIFAASFPAMRKGLLSDNEAEIARALFYRRVHTRPMWAEVEALPRNVQRVLQAGSPEQPFHVFISREASDEWKQTLVAYAEATGGEALILNAGHHVHLDQPERIAAESRRLIEHAGDH